MSELEAYIRLGFGCSIKDAGGMDWNYKQIAKSFGSDVLTFHQFCDWLQSDEGEAVQMAIEWGE